MSYTVYKNWLYDRPEVGDKIVLFGDGSMVVRTLTEQMSDNLWMLAVEEAIHWLPLEEVKQAIGD